MNKANLTDKMINGLRKTATELEEFRLQATLGKYEARDIYESAKKQFGKFAQKTRTRISNTRDQARDKTMKITNALEMLQVYMKLGRAETKIVFEEQRKKILRGLKELEALVRKVDKVDEFYARIHMEIEKFRIKLEIIKLRYELNKFAVKEEFENRKEAFSKKLGEIKKNLRRKEGKVNGKWSIFSSEIGEAYEHIRKAFVG